MSKVKNRVLQMNFQELFKHQVFGKRERCGISIMILTMIHGLSMALADSVPGVSGGTKMQSFTLPNLPLDGIK